MLPAVGVDKDPDDRYCTAPVHKAAANMFGRLFVHSSGTDV